MYINRRLEKEIEPFLGRKEVIAIIGPRQAGKTTLLKNLEKKLLSADKKVKFITFEKISDLNLFQTDLESFIELNKQYEVIIIDEFQYAQDGGKKLKYLFDTTSAKYIISGSSSLELTFQTGKYMVGRMVSFTLYPFSFREYLLAVSPELHNLLNNKIPDAFTLEFDKAVFSNEINQRLKNSFETYLIWGGYPAITLAKTESEKGKLLESIVSNYLLKDISSLLKLATENKLLRLIKFLAVQLASLINYNELSNVADLKFLLLKEHLNILKETYVIDIITPFYKNKRTELVKNPKVYFVDNGFRNYILSDYRKIELRNDYGSLVENVVLGELRRVKEEKYINFWRTKSGAEIDFIIESAGDLLPIESKYSSNPNIGKNMYSFINKYYPNEAIILTKDRLDKVRVKETTVKFLPVYYL